MNMESQKIKEDRRRKFLNKMENKNKKNKEKENNNNNDTTPEPQNESDISPSVNNDLTKNLLNQIENQNLFNNIINNQNSKGIDFKNIIEETDKYDYMINFQNIIKRILIIILSIIHCINNSPLNNTFVFKWTFVVLELSSVFFNKYYYSKKVELRKKMMNNTNKNEGKQNNIEIIIQALLNNFGFFSHFFVFFKAIKDLFYDISILIIINIIYLIFKSRDI